MGRVQSAVSVPQPTNTEPLKCDAVHCWRTGLKNNQDDRRPYNQSTITPVV
jgi:hypothetical protein